MMQTAIAHLEVNLRVLDQPDHVRRLLAMHVSKQPDQALPQGAFDFGGNLMQREFALRLQLLKLLVSGNAERNAELVEGKGDCTSNLPLGIDIRREQPQQ